MPPRWLLPALRRLHEDCAAGSLRFTAKATQELTALRLAPVDAIEMLAGLEVGDFSERTVSNITGEWLFVFRPTSGSMRLYVKLLFRPGCVVISFHEERT